MKKYQRFLFELIKKLIPNRFKAKLVDIISENRDVTEEIAFPQWLSICEEDIQYSNALIKKSPPIGEKININFLIPTFYHPYGGIFTILRIGNYLKSMGHSVKFVIYDNPKFNITDATLENIRKYLPWISKDDFLVIERYENIPNSDIAIATLWASCYALLKLQNTKKKIYLIQDYEPLFYPAGTTYGLAEATYSFPFHRIVNTKGLYDFINIEYPPLKGIKSMYFTPGVDTRYVYTPKIIGEKVKIFFYARPSTPRNAFGIGVNVLKLLKEKYKNHIEIVVVGENFDHEDIGSILDGMEVVGVVPYDELPSFYSQFHLGISFMFTKHPSYLPFEMMKSGCLVITNYNKANLWLLEHRFNCIMTSPHLSLIFKEICEVIESPSLYRHMVQNAYETVRSFTWEQTLSNIHKFMKEP